MKGLNEYIKKHGKHFTEPLAHDVSGNKFSADQVKKAAQKKVYYNVTGSTLGDMVYLTNMTYNDWKYRTVDRCIIYTLYIIGEYKYHGGVLFDSWLEELVENNQIFDFTPYI